MGTHGFWRRLISLTRKEFRQLLRDRSNLMIGIGLPIVLILIFGFGLSLDVKQASIAVAMQDRSPQAREVVNAISQSPYMTVVPAESLAEATLKLDRHEVDALLLVQNDFSRNLSAGHAQVQLITQGGDPSRALVIQGYVEGAIGTWGQKAADRAGNVRVRGTSTGVMVTERMWFNAANDSTWYLVPGLIVLIMTLVGTFLTALVMAREWERGTLEALFVTPVRPVEILVAKIIPYFCVGMLGLFLCLVAARLLFNVPLHGSLLVLIVASMIYMFVSLGIGLLISAMTKSQFLASQLAILASFLPAMMLSGFVFDLRNVPTAVQIVGQMLPATYFMQLAKSLFLAGNQWPLIIKNCTILLAYAVVVLGAARIVTRKKLD
ncbi:MAG: ABC transporter permease [Comamonadaceae bacterium]|nr:MAG: ABC transporter permease [Comamonadaceae bacterium]